MKLTPQGPNSSLRDTRHGQNIFGHPSIPGFAAGACHPRDHSQEHRRERVGSRPPLARHLHPLQNTRGFEVARGPQHCLHGSRREYVTASPQWTRKALVIATMTDSYLLLPGPLVWHAVAFLRRQTVATRWSWSERCSMGVLPLPT